MAKIENEHGIFFVPDEVANDQTKTVADVNASAIPWAQHEQSLMNEHINGGLLIANEAFINAVDEICLRTGNDIQEQLSAEFFRKYDAIFLKLYKANLLPGEFLELNKESLEEAYNEPV